MAFNTQFDGLHLSPAFIFPESQSYGSINYPLNPVEEPLPWQPVSLRRSQYMDLSDHAHCSQYNRWVFPSAIVEDYPGASQLPAEGRRGPLDEVYASSSLPSSPASDLLLGDNPSPLATFAGSSSSMAQNNHADREVCG